MRIPKHIALIPDGNRRWANQAGLAKQDGYSHGLNPGVRALELAQQYGIPELTYYGFTTDNCKRPPIQVSAFIKACIDAIELIKSKDADLLVVGNTASPMFPKELLPYTIKRVRFGKGITKVNFLVNYGWEWDLGHLNCSTHNRQHILSSLGSKEISRIDLIIRWGGRKRLSGLLPVQSVYADFFTLDEMWPEFCDSQFIKALDWYAKQDITLGG